MVIVNILEGWEAQWDAGISSLLPCQCKGIFTWLETFTPLQLVYPARRSGHHMLSYARKPLGV